MAPSDLRPTLEQTAILDADRHRNLMIRAYAGTGKSSTLQLIDAANPGPTLLVCFNRSVAQHAEKLVRSTTTVRTLNSLGHRVWADRCATKLKLDPAKILNIFRWLCEMEDPRTRKQYWIEWDLVRQGVDLARALGYIPDDHIKAEKRLCTRATLAHTLDETPSPLALLLIDRILIESIRQAYKGIIDFADQPYMAALFGATYPKFPLVLIDEYQDLSPVNHAMIAKLTRSSRQIGVGDEAQAIYGFRGATNDSMATAITAYDMLTLPLSISFRCPERIVANVRWRVPDFRAHHLGGTVRHSDQHYPPEHSAVICRNNAPLVAMAMTLLKAGRTVDLAGIDIAKRLTKIMTGLGPESATRAQAIDALHTWEEGRAAVGSASSTDLAACISTFLEHSTTLGGALAYVRHIFAASGTTTFLTGHKAKGLEWPDIYHLDPDLISDRGQDPNLRYVIDTRSSANLTYMESRDED